MAYIKDGKTRRAFYKTKGQNAMSGSTPGDRFSQHVADTMRNANYIIDNLEAGKATFSDARADVANYVANTKDIWHHIKHGGK